jgi:hypothetical protein
LNSRSHAQSLETDTLKETTLNQNPQTLSDPKSNIVSVPKSPNTEHQILNTALYFRAAVVAQLAEHRAGLGSSPSPPPPSAAAAPSPAPAPPAADQQPAAPAVSTSSSDQTQSILEALFRAHTPPLQPGQQPPLSNPSPPPQGFAEVQQVGETSITRRNTQKKRYKRTSRTNNSLGQRQREMRRERRRGNQARRNTHKPNHKTDVNGI